MWYGIGDKMRTIKFRGKRVDNGEWVYGGVEQKSITIIYDDTLQYDNETLVFKETVGQFTGLYDKNGKEIYEGDIVVGYGTWNLFVCIEQGHTLVKWKDYDSSKQIFNLEQNWINEEECVIVGNIHDNKEIK